MKLDIIKIQEQPNSPLLGPLQSLPAWLLVSSTQVHIKIKAGWRKQREESREHISMCQQLQTIRGYKGRSSLWHQPYTEAQMKKTEAEQQNAIGQQFYSSLSHHYYHHYMCYAKLHIQ